MPLPDKLRRVVKFLGGYAEILLIVCGAALVLGWFERFSFLTDALGQLRPQWIAGCLAAMLILDLNGKRRWAIGASALIVTGSIMTIPPLFLTAPASPKDDAQPALRVFAHNVLSSNENYSKVIASIRAADPDVILILEMTASWKAAMEVLEKDYPFQLYEARDDNFGFGFLSRVPVVKSEAVDLSGFDIPSARVTLNWRGKPVQILGTHTLPAMGSDHFRVRNWHLKDIVKEANTSTHPFIVAGDLNITPSSGAWRKMVKDARLRSAGNLIAPSWSPFHVPLMDARIDYVLVSSQWRVRKFQLGSQNGSDHKSVLVELTL